MTATATWNSTCIGHLGRCDTDRIVSIYVATPKVVKASTVKWNRMSLLPAVSLKHVANVNYPLPKVSQRWGICSNNTKYCWHIDFFSVFKWVFGSLWAKLYFWKCSPLNWCIFGIQVKLIDYKNARSKRTSKSDI